MRIRRIETTVYFVKGWDSSVSFYRDLLGLKPLVIVPRVWAHFEAPGGGGSRFNFKERTATSRLMFPWTLATSAVLSVSFGHEA